MYMMKKKYLSKIFDIHDIFDLYIINNQYVLFLFHNERFFTMKKNSYLNFIK